MHFDEEAPPIVLPAFFFSQVLKTLKIKKKKPVA